MDKRVTPVKPGLRLGCGVARRDIACGHTRPEGERDVLKGGAAMAEAPRFDIPPPGGVAWLEVSAEDSNGATGRARTGPLGLQISPLAQSRAPYFFKGARLRGTRCVWSASTVSGAELLRPARAGISP